MEQILSQDEINLLKWGKLELVEDYFNKSNFIRLKTNQFLSIKIVSQWNNDCGVLSWLISSLLGSDQNDQNDQNTLLCAPTLKANPNFKNSQGDTPLHLLCKSAEANGLTLGLLIAHGCNVNIVNNLGESPLHILCSRSEHKRVNYSLALEKIQVLLHWKANPNKGNLYGETPLHFLFSQDIQTKQFVKFRILVFKLFLKYGFDLKTKNNSGETILHNYCFHCGEFSTLKILMRQFLKILNCQTDDCKNTCLHALTLYNPNPKSINLLISNGADLSLQNSDGETPLHCLINSVPHQDILQNLIPKFINQINIQDMMGSSPFHLICLNSFNYPQTLLNLLSNPKIDYFLENYKGNNMMHLLCFTVNANFKLIEIANSKTDFKLLNKTNNKNQTPLYFIVNSLLRIFKY
ncbi:hypothetical protein M0813_13757 [Anaeramoeba flamelloides]|uniref:Ankyrin repeat protein n=1 Tax=Anaeramoeba flamelloides TaxID=1746091 RepID=A0ABQ8Z847_9EUKA|nr:hypothetical protein M0813_13757 [Anaeramoeba flamelloides]